MKEEIVMEAKTAADTVGHNPVLQPAVKTDGPEIAFEPSQVIPELPELVNWMAVKKTALKEAERLRPGEFVRVSMSLKSKVNLAVMQAIRDAVTTSSTDRKSVK